MGPEKQLRFVGFYKTLADAEEDMLWWHSRIDIDAVDTVLLRCGLVTVEAWAWINQEVTTP